MKKLVKFNNTNFCLTAILMALLMWSSCKVDKISSLKPSAESVKDLTGTWRVIKATLNGRDLLGALSTNGDTSAVYYNKFAVKFTATDYTLVNPMPFIVTQNGKFTLDNSQYAFKITFKPTSTAEASSAFTYPIVNGIRQLTLVFSPGCAQNVYQYTLKRDN